MANLEHPDALLTKRLGTYSHEFDERDLVLYALGVGCGVQDRKYVYECAADFAALPTFAVIPAHPVAFGVPLEHYVPSYDRSKTLHGEQYLELHAPLPHTATVVTRAEVLDVQDKGKGAVVVLRATTVDAASGHLLAVNEFTSFALGTAPFQGVSHPRPRPAAATAPNVPPAGRQSDVVVEEATGVDQAALYRLSGDYNPLHIDPSVSKRAGFPVPILHGLCTMGISAKHVLRAFGGDDPASVASIKVRFAKHVLPGETLRVEMWQADPVTVVFQTRVVERNVLAITNAAMVFKQPVQMVQQQQGRPASQQQQRTQAKL